MTTIENQEIRIGDVTLKGERRDGSDLVRVEWFGRCPHTGAELIISLLKDSRLPPDESDLPWCVTLWPAGDSDGTPTCRRFAKLSRARAALTDSYRAHLRC